MSPRTGSGIGVALVGFGASARTFHAPLIAATPGLALVRAVVRSVEAAKAAAAAGMAAGTLDEALADPAVQLVVVATPSGGHVEPAARALRAGRHVVVEKPLAATAAEADALAALVRDQGRVLTVFHNRRFDADFLSLRALLDRGDLGEVVEVVSAWDRYRPVVRDRWRERAGPGAGSWQDLGSHMIDQALVLFGRPERVWADIGAQRAGAEAPDYFHVRLGYAGPLRVSLRGSSLAAAPAPRFTVHGTRASFVKEGLDPQEAALQAGAVPGGPGWGLDPSPGRIVRDGAAVEAGPNLPGDYPAFYAAVREAILKGASPPVAVGEAVEVVRLLELAQRSAALGRSLAV